MPFTKTGLNYSTIEKHIKGITFISKGSIGLLKAAYGGKLEETAKLLAGYTWLTTRDTTMILITVALLVLAEKHEDKFKNELSNLKGFRIIANALRGMARGDGQKIVNRINGIIGFKNLFIAILKTADIQDEKAEKIWKGYENQISKIKPWKHSTDTLIDCVSPILECSLTKQYFDIFETYLPPITAQSTVNYRHIVERVINNTQEQVQTLYSDKFGTPKTIEIGLLSPERSSLTCIRCADTKFAPYLDDHKNNSIKIIFRETTLMKYIKTSDENERITVDTLTLILVDSIKKSIPKIKEYMAKSNFLSINQGEDLNQTMNLQFDKPVYFSGDLSKPYAKKRITNNDIIIKEPFEIGVKEMEVQGGKKFLWIVTESKKLVAYLAENNKFSEQEILDTLRSFILQAIDAYKIKQQQQ